MTDNYDLIAIGAGPAGESATELASFFGHRSLIIEKNRPGGTVTTTGGAPTKTLREAALYVSGFREGDVYGLRMAAPPEVATEIVRNRTWSVCDLLQKVTRDNIAKRDVDYLEGAACLEEDGAVLVTGKGGESRRLRAKTVLIATGSRPFRPPNISFEIPGVCDTDTILHRGRVPKDVLIVGGGPVGVEFATICHALGANVTLLDRGARLIPMMDHELSSAMSKLFADWGVRVHLDSTVESASPKGDGLEVRLSTGETLRPDTLLFAAGRLANTQGLGLEAAGVELDPRGRIRVDEHFRTSAAGIYAAGDVLRPTLASIAMEQGRAAICHAFGIPFEGTVDPTPVSSIYGMPEVSGAGLTEEQCRTQGLDYEVGRADLALTPRGAIAGRGGLLKLIFLKGDRRLIGVHCIGDLASEIIGIGQMAIRCGGTMNTIANMSFNTPTYSYAYKYAAFDGLRRLAAARGPTAGRAKS
jgi:NAD(P) transhydrogenase